jgi:NitT/TauT family transport system ATP-binding protein
MVEIELRGVGKSFASGGCEINVLQDIDLAIPKGGVVAIRGDNGSGKTTLLNIIAGIEVPSQGTVQFHGLEGVKLRVGYAQQDYTSSLLPWFNVIDNVSLPLRLRGMTRSDRNRSAERLLDSLGSKFGSLPRGNFPHQLSGGQKQGVAIARALVHDPHLLLLDEPFTNLDAHTSRDLQDTLSYIHKTHRTSILYVSHVLDHCIYLADRILLLYGRPARIVGDFRVPLPHPRKRNMILGAAFQEVRTQIIAEEESLYAKGD